MPHNTKVERVAWSVEDGLLAVGGEKGLLKVIKFEDKKPVLAAGAAGSSTNVNLQTNQTLTRHTGLVNICVWNDVYRKLTTSDENGVIVVWINQDGYWYEEMINDRGKSYVVDMKWSPDGSRICICYEDGAVIVGGVEGNRQWGKDLKHRLQFVEWSPDGKLVLFGTPEGEVRIYDDQGQPLYQTKILCFTKNEIDSVYTPNKKLAAIQWYEGTKMYTDDTPPGLCIAYECGRVQLMKNEKDDRPIVFDTEITTLSVKWNPTGTIFAVGGYIVEAEQPKGMVQFYNNQGYYLKAITINNADKVTSLSWEGSGLRISMAAGTSVYYANIKPDYKWGFMEHTIVLAYQKADRIDYCIIFWDFRLQTKNLKYVKNLLHIKTSEEYCILVSKVEEQSDQAPQWVVVLCNSIGSPLESKFINVDPNYVYMTKTHVIICSLDHIYVWQYRSQSAKAAAFESMGGSRRLGKEVAFYVEDTPNMNAIYDKDRYDVTSLESNDPITSVTANDSIMVVGRASGSLVRYSLPHITVEAKLFLKYRPNIMEVNCNSTKLAIIDNNGTLSLMEMDNQGGGTVLEYEKSDVWQVKWSNDDPTYLAFIEKSRLYTMKVDKSQAESGKPLEPEEPFQTEAYICSFSGLQVKLVLLDELMKEPDGNFKPEECLCDYETKTLRDTRELLGKLNLKDAYNYIKQNSHIKLWRILSEKALDDLDFSTAENALVECGDYQGLQLIKKLQLIDDKNKQKAEIQAFQGRFDDAESIYRNMERKDLAIQLRMKVGDWFKVVDLIKEGFGNDDILMQAYDKLGDYYADRFKWDEAAGYYKLSKNYEKLVDAYFNIEDFEGMKGIIEIVPEGNNLLMEIGEKLQSVGLCDEAVDAFLKAGNVKRALDCCVLLNQWAKAVELAEKYNFVQVEGLLTMYANQLLEKRKKLECVELYRRANRNTEAAKMLGQIAGDLVKKNANPLIVKKLYVMAALEVDLYKKRVIEATLTGQGATTAKTLDSLITSDINTSTDKILNNPWRGAEAWHFYILAQRQLYNGEYKAALKSALRAAEYELELDTKQVYSLLALTSYYQKNWRECSRAFVKLEGMKSNTEDETERYQELASMIFSKYAPRDSPCENYSCPGKNCGATITEFMTHCRTCGTNFSPCVASGRSILQKEYYTCKPCKHRMIEGEIVQQGLKFCALCHGPIDFKAMKGV